MTKTKIIDKRRIIDLIGNNRNRYHSCIITTYSFDFVFFESIFLPALSTANVRNVHLLIDGNMLDVAIRNAVGREFGGTQANRTYSFTPINQNGAFHPKIIMLFGKNQGLLLVGSGNMTNAGIHNNDEIWGAFHYHNKKSPNAPMFAAAWEYLQPFLLQSKGITNQKISWISKNSKWLKSLKKQRNQLTKINNTQTVRLIANQKGKGILEQLEGILPKFPNVISIISPYFDKKGELLDAIEDVFMPDSINCIVDVKNGTFPTKWTPNENYNFFRWINCFKETNGTRLHAKAILFYYDNEQYLLLGSPNASWQAFGTKDKNPINSEAALLLHETDIKIDLYSKLGIELKRFENFKDLVEDAKANSNSFWGEFTTSSEKRGYSIRIVHAERKEELLKIYLKSVLNHSISVCTYNRYDEILDRISITSGSDKYEIKLTNTDDIFKVAFVDTNNEIISNSMLIHRTDIQEKCNPDAKAQHIEDLIENGVFEGNELSDILEYFALTWIDDEYITKKSIPKSLKAKNKKGKTPRIFTEEERETFYNERQQKAKEEYELTQALDGVLEQLFARTPTNKSSEENFEDNLEEAERDNEEGTTSISMQSSQTVQSFTNNDTKTLQVLTKHFGNVKTAMKKNLEKFLNTLALSTKKDETPEVTLSLMANILTYLTLYVKYNGYIGRYKDEEIEEEFPFFILGEFHEINSLLTVKGFLTNTIANFVLLCTNFNEYEDENVIKKIAVYRFKLTSLILFAIFNTNWRPSEREKVELMILDVLMLINQSEINDEFIQQLEYELSTIKSKAKYHFIKYSENKKRAFEIIFPAFKNWKKLWDLDRKSLIKPKQEFTGGEFIFNSQLGFMKVKKVRNEEVDLIKTGFYYDGSECFRIKMPSKLIQFNY